MAVPSFPLSKMLSFKLVAIFISVMVTDFVGGIGLKKFATVPKSRKFVTGTKPAGEQSNEIAPASDSTKATAKKSRNLCVWLNIPANATAESLAVDGSRAFLAELEVGIRTAFALETERGSRDGKLIGSEQGSQGKNRCPVSDPSGRKTTVSVNMKISAETNADTLIANLRRSPMLANTFREYLAKRIAQLRRSGEEVQPESMQTPDYLDLEHVTGKTTLDSATGKTDVEKQKNLKRAEPGTEKDGVVVEELESRFWLFNHVACWLLPWGRSCKKACHDDNNKDACNRDCEDGDPASCKKACDEHQQASSCQKSCDVHEDSTSCKKACDEHQQASSCQKSCDVHEDSTSCKKACDEHQQASSCQKSCDVHEDSASCEKACGTYSYSTSCKKACDDHQHASSCQKSCDVHEDSASCEKACGTYSYSTSCKKACDDHQHASSCQKSCDEHEDQASCGDACDAGFGTSCKNACENGDFEYCGRACKQYNYGTSCAKGCTTFEIDSACSEACRVHKNRAACRKLVGLCMQQHREIHRDRWCPRACKDTGDVDSCQWSCGRPDNCTKLCLEDGDFEVCSQLCQRGDSEACKKGCSDAAYGAYCNKACVTRGDSAACHQVCQRDGNILGACEKACAADHGTYFSSCVKACDPDIANNVDPPSESDLTTHLDGATVQAALDCEKPPPPDEHEDSSEYSLCWKRGTRWLYLCADFCGVTPWTWHHTRMGTEVDNQIVSHSTSADHPSKYCNHYCADHNPMQLRIPVDEKKRFNDMMELKAYACKAVCVVGEDGSSCRKESAWSPCDSKARNFLAPGGRWFVVLR